MGCEGVVLPAQIIGQDLSIRSRHEQVGVEEFISEEAIVDEVEQTLYTSEKPVSHGDPGSMQAVVCSTTIWLRGALHQWIVTRFA
jgi:hypothetical protein